MARKRGEAVGWMRLQKRIPKRLLNSLRLLLECVKPAFETWSAQTGTPYTGVTPERILWAVETYMAAERLAVGARRREMGVVE